MSSVQSNLEVTFDHNNQNYRFQFNVDDSKKSKNLDLLFKRSQGTYFYADEGALKEVKGTKGRIRFFFQDSAKVRKIVTESLRCLDLNHLEDPTRKAFLEHYFDSKLGEIGRMSARIFDRSAFKRDDLLSRHLAAKETVRLKIGQKYFYDFYSPNTEFQILHIDLQSDDLNEKFAALLKRNRGIRFLETPQKIQEISLSVLQALEAYLEESNIDDIHRIAILHIFQESSFSRTNAWLFRTAVKQKRATLFNELENTEIEKILISEMQKKKENLLQVLSSLGENKTPEKLLELEAKSFELLDEEFFSLQKMGIDLEDNTDGGSGGARYALNRKGKKIYVVKPGDEGPHSKLNPKWYAPIKRMFVSPRKCLRDNSEAIAEYKSWLLDRKFQLYVVPPTYVREVKSKKFNGEERKECSVQMFIEGCDTLAGNLKLSSKWFSMPRPMLEGKFKKEENELKERLPQALLERIGIHNALIEDIDCHFDNILVKETPRQEATLMDRLLRGDEVSEGELREFVKHFFKNNGMQQILGALLTSEINQNGSRVTLIKHDGGSTHPKFHPEGYLSTRFKHLFETLPHFDKKFSENDLQILDHEKIVKTILEQSLIELRQRVLDDTEFSSFWEPKENRKAFVEWMFSMEQSEFTKRLELVNQLKKHEKITEKNERLLQLYFNANLRRIKQNMRTRLECFRVLNKMAANKAPLRDFYRNTRSLKDFKKEILSLKLERAKEFLKTVHAEHFQDFFLKEVSLFSQWLMAEKAEEEVLLRSKVIKKLQASYNQMDYKKWQVILDELKEMPYNDEIDLYLQKCRAIEIPEEVEGSLDMPSLLRDIGFDLTLGEDVLELE